MLRKKGETKKGSFYRKSLILVLLITCLPVTFIGISLYYAGGGRIVAALNQAHQQQLNQSIQRIEDYFTQLELYSAQLAFNPGFDATITTLDFNDQFQKTNELLKSLSLKRESNPLIDSVFLYLKDQNRLIGDNAGVRRIESEEDRKLFRTLLDPVQGIYWKNGLKRIDNNTSQKAIVIKLPGGAYQEQTYGAFVIYINQQKLDELVEKLAPKEGAAFLIDQNAEYVTTQQPISIETGTNLEQYIRDHVLKENREGNTSEVKWHKESYSVSYGKLSFIGNAWTYISATPISQIIAPVTSMSKLILFISCIGLLAALALSWFASQRIYDSIRRLMRLFQGDREGDERDEITFIENQWKRYLLQNESLSARLKEALPHLREGFLLQLLQGHHYYYSESEIIEKMRQFDWDILDSKFAFLMVQLNGMSSTDGKFSDKDEQLVSFAASKIMQELATAKFPLNHVIDFQDMSAAALLVLDSEDAEEDVALSIQALSDQIMEAINDMLAMKATIVISSVTDSIVQTPDMLEQTRKALLFRDMQSANQVLSMDDLKKEEANSAQYPFELEREIATAVRLGQEDEVMQLIGEFLGQLQVNSRKELIVHQGMMKLLSSILDAIMRSETNPYMLYEGVHLYEQLMQIHEPVKMLDWFRQTIVVPFIRSRTMASDPQTKQSIDSLLTRLQREYLSDISLETYAGDMNMSPYKLSKMFKQSTGTNFIDYVTKLRLDKCKELLLTTDLKINDIAETLRYQPSYLIRIFKKNEGLTPGQFRDKHAG